MATCLVCNTSNNNGRRKCQNDQLRGLKGGMRCWTTAAPHSALHFTPSANKAQGAREKIVKIASCQVPYALLLRHKVDTFDLVFTLLVDLLELVQVLLAGLPVAF